MYLELRATPRPPPPARSRKVSPLYNCYPPPPYSSMDSVLGSPIPGTAQLLGSSPDLAPASEDWVREKSREELSELLLKADGIIKSRESELGLTSAICNSLHKDNVILKSKHDALISRLPISYSQSPVVSPLASPHLRNVSLSRFVDDPDRAHSPAFDKASRRRSRRISMTQTEIGQLADQNSELLAQIDNLQNEATLADQAGKRKLRKLEMEIQGLRDELGNTQAELEAEKVDMGIGNEDVLKQRLDREEKLQALRSKRGSDPEILDFAPPSHFPSSSMPSTGATPRMVRKMRSSSVLAEHDDPDPSLRFQFPARNKELHVSEHSLISRLLLKIRELEEANEEITHQNRIAVAKMRSARQGAESMMRVYDCFDEEEDIEVEVVPEFAQEDISTDIDPGDTTIRFSSLRRTINEDVFKQLLDRQDGFGSNIEDQMHSTVHESSPSRPQKIRKSVVGLFNDSTSKIKPLSPSNDVLDGVHPLITTGLDSPVRSRSLSPLDPGLKFGQTLGSELGSEFGEDWNTNAGNFHLRTTSLYSLNEGSGDSSKLPSSVPGEPTNSSSTGDQDLRASPLLQGLDQEDEHVLDIVPDVNKTYSRSQRLSETVRSRSDRWTDRRLNQSESSLFQSSEKIQLRTVQKRVSSWALLTEQFNAVAEDIAPTGNRKLEAPPSEDLTKDSSVTDTQSSVQMVKRDGFVGFALEIWLWLQFLIIIVVFLLAMAKRGPKSVLRHPERQA